MIRRPAVDDRRRRAYLADFTTARYADALSLECSNVVRRATEGAGGFELLDDDAVAFDGNCQVVALTDLEEPPRFGRNYNAAQVVDLPGHACVHETSQMEIGGRHP